MRKVAVVYWSGTGNTEEMANAVAEGAKSAGCEVCLAPVAEFSAERMDEFDAVAFGCPAMGAEELEDSEFDPLFQDCRGKLSGKKIALFGSYGWGDGEWMRAPGTKPVRQTAQSWPATASSARKPPTMRLWKPAGTWVPHWHKSKPKYLLISIDTS